MKCLVAFLDQCFISALLSDAASGGDLCDQRDPGRLQSNNTRHAWVSGMMGMHMMMRMVMRMRVRLRRIMAIIYRAIINPRQMPL
jgi:hypothetical protein